MAKFVDYDPSEQGINFTGRSQGFTSPLEVIGKGIQGFAQTASLFQKNKAAGEDDALKNEISQINDTVQTGQIKTLETNPPGLDQGLGKIKRLGTAYNQGGDTDTWGKLNLELKKLKQKYPNKIADIDAYASTIVKASMANDYRGGLSAQRDAALKAEQDAASDTEKYWRSWVGTNQDDLTRAGIDPKTIDVTNENQMRTLQTHVSTIQADDKSVLAAKSALELEKAAGNDPLAKAKKLATREVANKTTQFLKAANPVYNEFIQSKDLALKDGRIDPEEATQLRQTWTAVRTQLKSEVTSLVNSGTYAEIMTNKSDRDDIIAVADSQMSVIDDMLTNQNWGLLGETLRQTTSKYEARELETLEGKYGSYASSLQHGLKNGLTLEAIDAAYSDLMGGPAKLMEAKQDYARRFLTGGIVTGKIDNLGNGLAAAAEDGAKPEEIKRTLSDVQRILTDPNQDPAVVANVAKGTFQSGSNDVLLKQFNDKSRRQVFNLLADKRIGERLKGTPEYKNYENWIKDQFAGLNKQNIDTIVENQAVLDHGTTMKFDESTGTFQILEDPRKQPSFSFMPQDMSKEDAIRQTNALKNAVTSINGDLKRIHEVVEGGDSGLNAVEEQKLLLGLSGMNKLPPEVYDKIMKGDTKLPTGKNEADPVGFNLDPPSLKHIESVIPEARPVFESLATNLAARGVPIQVVQGKRTGEEQDRLYAQGRTTPGEKVTWTRNSKHEHGSAIDVVPEELADTPNWSPESPLWKIVGEEAAKLGLKWGISKVPGEVDKPHLEYVGRKMAHGGGTPARQQTDLDRATMSTTGKPPKASSTVAKTTPTQRNVPLNQSPTKPLQDFVGKAEGADYNTRYGGGRENLSALSIDDLINDNEGPAGKYQVTSDTLKDLKDRGIISGDEMFTPETQDKLFAHFMERAGLEQYQKGDISEERFMDRLAKIWASLPAKNGKSHYDGISNNQAKVSREEVLQEIRKLKKKD